MNDFEQFEQLIQTGTYCISIVSQEERYALEIVRKTATKLKRDMWIWTIAEGVRDGLLDGSPCVADTDTPPAGLSSLARAKAGSLCVTLDLSEHVRGGKALRILRDIVDSFHKTGVVIVMIDSNDNLPDVIKAYAKRFELSYPDEERAAADHPGHAPAAQSQQAHRGRYHPRGASTRSSATCAA